MALDLPCLRPALCDLCHNEQWAHYLPNSNIRVCFDCSYRLLAKSNFAKIQNFSFGGMEDSFYDKD